ncbi:hypothetical protein ACFL07_00310 [Pseudomonadota bacterium]
MKFNAPLKVLLPRMSEELVIVELAAWSAYHHDRLPQDDRDRVLLAIRRLDAIREAVDARLK